MPTTNPPLVWTDAAPTEPGLWMYRYDKSEPMHQWSLIVARTHGPSGQLVRANERSQRAAFSHGEYAGPIPPPADAPTPA